jgi:hypothetical protein
MVFTIGGMAHGARVSCYAAYTVGQVTTRSSRALASIRAAKRSIIRTLVWIAGVTIVIAAIGLCVVLLTRA